MERDNLNTYLNSDECAYDRDLRGRDRLAKYEELSDFFVDKQPPLQPDVDHDRYPLFLTCANCGYYFGNDGACDCDKAN